MTLKELEYIICQTAIRNKVINSAGSGTSIYQLNPADVREYMAFFVAPTGNHIYKTNRTDYAVTLYAFDRLLEDDSNDNEIFSTAVEVIKDVVKALRANPDIIDVAEDIAIINFAEVEKMADRVAGAYANVIISVKDDDICPSV